MNQTMPSLDISIRPAAEADFSGAADLLKGADLPLAGVQEHFAQFLVLEHHGELAGVCGLEVYGKNALIRSLAVSPDRRGLGFGRHLSQAMVQKAEKMGLQALYLLTETAEEFFARQGFEIIDRHQADPDVQCSVEFREACPASATCMYLRLF